MEPQAIIDVFRRTVSEHYFDFNGRTGRREFWYYVIAVIVIMVVVGIIGAILGTRILHELATLALFLPNLGIGARRLHDTNRTAMLLLLPIVPAVLATIFVFTIILLPLAWLCWLAVLAATIALIYFYAQPGTTGPNQYGAEPATPPAAAPAA